MTELLALLPLDHSRRTAILDSNLLVLAVTASIDEALLRTFKRVRGYTSEDVKLLRWLVGQFKAPVTTAYVLAEVSNLANELTGSVRQQWFEQLAVFARSTTEAHIATQHVGLSTLLPKFGVTDAALSSLAEQHVLITAEHRLSGYLEEERYVINFNHFRPLWMAWSG